MAKFRTKARAVELLGKGQIADLPTAISELWKNGYDAYADNLSCGLYLEGYKNSKVPLFELSDDGVGMSRQDLLDKWIVLGTDSKSRGTSTLKSEDRLGKDPRIPMGEKGIGRLSVAYLGNQMLMLTKKINEPCQALFMDWRVLENYNLFIDDLEIPIDEFWNEIEFRDIFPQLINVFKSNTHQFNWPEQQKLREEISKELNSIELPTFFFDDILKRFIREDYHGTSFIILKPHELLFELSDFVAENQKDNTTVLELRKSLSGLYNVMRGEQKFQTEFDIYNNAGKYNILDDFFTPDDLKICDHFIKGRFDEFGFFSGEVRVFNQTETYNFKPIRPPGQTPYGPFEIELGVMEGTQKKSKLTEEQYARLDKKAESFGGLYIYRDGFRVLPYGRTEFDFLEFEKRRSKSAGYYFFSQRNMMGSISISRETNSGLVDKAGREGFIANKAYREFRSDLISLFTDLSLTFFRSYGDKDKETNLRDQQLKEIQKRNEKILAAEKKMSKQTRKRFLEELKKNTPEIERLQQELDNLYERLNDEVQVSEINYNSYKEIVSQIESKKNELRELKIQKPKRVKITENQESKLEKFNAEYQEVAAKIESSEKIIYETRKRFDVQNLQNEFYRKYRNSIKEVSNEFNERKRALSNNFSRIVADFEGDKQDVVNTIKQQLQEINLDPEHVTKDEIQNSIQYIDNLVNSIKDQIHKNYSSFFNHISNLNLDVDDDLLVGWYKEQYEKIEEKLEMTNELAQLGMSIEIIDHQFNVMYSHMREAINRFKGLIQNNTEYQYYYNQLNTSYEHLVNNHRLLVPLFRTRRRNRTVIKGADIVKYLNNFFDAILKKNNISLTADAGFEQHEFYTFESIVIPVFINIINNAVYWLLPAQERKIHISKQGNEVLIMNNGEQIEDRYLEDIFTLFFSRRRDGRGIGLYLARTNLRSEGLDIFASNKKEYNKLKGACFIIKPYNPQHI